MERRTFLRATLLAATGAVAGCQEDDAATTESPATTGRDNPTDSPSTTESTRTDTDRPESTPTATLSGSEVVDLSGPPCEAVAGATFESVERQTGGPGPNGSTSEVHWRVAFDDGTFEYSSTDVVEGGSYTCEHDDGTATLEGESGGSGSTYSGRYDPETGVLVWDDVRYRPVAEG
jgi:hypothetical protein